MTSRTTRRSLPRVSVVLVMMLAVGAAACGGDDSGQPTTTLPTLETTSPPSAPTSTEAPAPTTTEPAAEPTNPPEDSAAPTALSQVQRPEASTVVDLLALDRALVIAHAGGDFEAPHSTMYAFTQAALVGTDVLEMDVMLTGDGVLVVHHDDTVDRTTEASGQVRTFTYDELAAFDNAHWFVEGTWSDRNRPDDEYELRGVRTGDRAAPEGYGPEDFKIETFRAVAEAFPDHVLDVELKIPRTAEGEPDLEMAYDGARVLAAEIEELGRTDSVIVVSFDDSVVAAFREFAPEVATSPGLGILLDWYVGVEVEFAPTDVVFQVPPVYEGLEVLTPEVIARAQAEGFDVWVWMDDTSTQEQADFYSDLLARGVDGLLVSRPSVAVPLVSTGT
jgi:glycerophosphoryl diester phosphodiesterase